MCARGLVFFVPLSGPTAGVLPSGRRGGNRRKGRAGGVKGGVKQTRGSAWRKKRKERGAIEGGTAPTKRLATG